MTSPSTDMINAIEGDTVDGAPAIQTRSLTAAGLVAPIVASGALALLETLPALYYGRYLAALQPGLAGWSGAISFAGTFATYLLIIQLSARRPWLRRLVVPALALWTVLLQVLYFGIYREFATLPTVSIVDFTRQTPEYAWALFKARLSFLWVAGAVLAVALSSCLIHQGFRWARRPSRNHAIVLFFMALGSYCYARPPFMSFGQHTARLVMQSSRGPGVVNAAWEPDRLQPYSEPAKHPVNIVIFRLEEIAAQATTLERPELLTMPDLKAMADELPEQVFVGHGHFANSTATDVSVLSIYTGLSPAADLESHRRVPLLWDYFSAAGYDTSLFLPFHLEWGDFKRRFNARPGKINLDKLMDAGSSGRPLVYDNSINDTDVLDAALDYQRGRRWAEPFLQIVSLKMPHAIGEGARVNELDYGDWGNEPAGLKDYYTGIRHDDLLIQKFLGEVPEAVKERTVFVLLSDHGTRLFARTDGVEELHRLDNYHQETTRVPFVFYVPAGAREILPDEKVRALRDNLSTRSTSNIDLVPTLVGLAGLRPVDVGVAHQALLVGRDLTEPVAATEAVVQLNTGALRRWDREHFGLVLDNGRYHYLFSMGRELLYDLQQDPAETLNVAMRAAYRQTLSKARALTAEVPELFRIQQKYKRQEGAGSAEADPEETSAAKTQARGEDDGRSEADSAGAARSLAVDVFGLEKFRQHECLTRAGAGACPNGYVVWGPYVRASHGTSARLKYEVAVEKGGVAIWLDLSTGTGRDRIAKSRVHYIDAPGVHRFELEARLNEDADALEGRLNAFAHGSPDGYAISIKRAELSLTRAD